MKRWRKHLLSICLIGTSAAFAQDNINYDESKVAPYSMPALMKCDNGREVKTIEQWEQMRRPELIELFSEQMYGRIPQEVIPVSYQLLSEHDVFDGKGRCQQIKFVFSKANHTHDALLLLYLPTHTTTPVPVFVSYTCNGNQSI